MTFNVLNLLNIVRDHMNRQFELNFMEFYPACFILQSWDAKVLTCQHNWIWVKSRMLDGGNEAYTDKEIGKSLPELRFTAQPLGRHIKSNNTTVLKQ